MAMTKIVNWNPERGFGFVQTEQGRAFLHCSAIEPRPARGENLEGKEVEVIEVASGDKGLRVVGAERLDKLEVRTAYVVQLPSGWRRFGFRWEWSFSGDYSPFLVDIFGGYNSRVVEKVLGGIEPGAWRVVFSWNPLYIRFLEKVSDLEEVISIQVAEERGRNGGWLIGEMLELLREAQEQVGRTDQDRARFNWSVYIDLAKAGLSPERIRQRILMDAAEIPPESPVSGEGYDTWYDHSLGIGLSSED